MDSWRNDAHGGTRVPAHRNRRPRGALASLVVALPLLQACAVVTAPGFDYADARLRSTVSLGRPVPADPANPPQGVVTPISPQLVKAQAELERRTLPAEVRSLFATAKPYTIGPGDVVGVTVYGHPELAQATAGTVINQPNDPTGISRAPGFIVAEDGQVLFPLIGRTRIEGLTESEAAELFMKKLARFLKEPQVSVRINSFRSRRAYVDGEVRTPGTQVFTDVPMTLPEALNRAGGISPVADRSQVILTRGERTTRIDMALLQELGVNPNQILLESGDMVTVRSRDDSKVFVMGEIARPSALPMRNGRMSLNEALGEAGGPNLLTANTRQIYVIRNISEGASPAIFHLNAGAPTALALADTFALRPRDVVYIDPVPLVSWNRIVSLILPSAQALNVGRSALGN